MTYEFQTWGVRGEHWLSSVQADGFDVLNVLPAEPPGPEYAERWEEIFEVHAPRIIERIAWVAGLTDEQFAEARLAIGLSLPPKEPQ